MDPNQGKFQLPVPVVELIRKTEDQFDKKWVNDLLPLIFKILEWSFIFYLGSFGFGFGWILFLSTLYYIQFHHSLKSSKETLINSKDEREIIIESMDQLPSWVNFPDVDRVEWINKVISQMWSSIGSYSTDFVKTFIEPNIKEILDTLDLKELSGFNLKKVLLGTIPLRIGGIKVYERSIRDEIILDSELIYAGDARIQFSLQKVSAEIRNIRFKGTVRITLKPLLGTFPLIGGFEVTFLKMPTLDYNLGGLGSVAEIPGVNTVVKSIVESQIRSRFVWPNRFRLYLPKILDYQIQDQDYKMIRPAGLLSVSVVEARDLVAKDKGFTGSGKSDPYPVVTIGERRISFQSGYKEKTLNPVWNYTADFIMEDSNARELRIDIMDYDHGSQDDFMGSLQIPTSRIISQNPYDSWISLTGVKHGEVHLSCQWQEINQNGGGENGVDIHIISLFVDSCKNLKKKSSSNPPYPKCVFTMMNGESRSTLPRCKTDKPVFQEGVLFLSKNLSVDEISIQVVDSKSTELLGRVNLSAEYIAGFRNKEMINMEMSLLDAPDTNASITISAKLFPLQD